MLQIIKVYGPYIRKKDNRKIVVLRLIDGTLTTKTYARFLYEKEHGDIGNINLTVDHKDEDVTNDVLNNFDLLTREDNIRKSAKIAEMYHGICPACDQEFEKRMKDVRGNLKQGKVGPFCSRYCAGRYSKQVQINNIAE